MTKKQETLDSRWKAAYERKCEAVRAYLDAIRCALRPGRKIHFTHGRHLLAAEVLDVSDDRVLVRGVTGRHYWVDAWRIMVAL